MMLKEILYREELLLGSALERVTRLRKYFKCRETGCFT